VSGKEAVTLLLHPHSGFAGTETARAARAAVLPVLRRSAVAAINTLEDGGVWSHHSRIGGGGARRRTGRRDQAGPCLRSPCGSRNGSDNVLLHGKHDPARPR